jgi:hypothetical protein
MFMPQTFHFRLETDGSDILSGNMFFMHLANAGFRIWSALREREVEFHIFQKSKFSAEGEEH